MKNRIEITELVFIDKNETGFLVSDVTGNEFGSFKLLSDALSKASGVVRVIEGEKLREAKIAILDLI